MRALTFQDVETLAVATVDDPGIVAPGDVVVRVRWAGICGSDLHVYHGRERGLDAGTVMGHELAGEVVATGSEVRRFAVGDDVVSPFTTSCGSCFYCDDGLTARCEHGQLLGWVEEGRGLHGCQAEYVRIPLADASLVAAPREAPLDLALLAGDILATGFFGAEGAGAAPGRSIGVVGCGPVGLMAVVAARELGAERVFAIDSIGERLALAAGWGATPVELRNSPAAVLEATGGRGVDGVVEAVGSPGATRTAVDLVRHGGTVAAVGVHTEASFAFAPGEAYDRNLTYRAGRCPARRYMERALAVIASERYDLDRLISHRLSLEEGVDAYAMFAERRPGCTKILLAP